MSHWRSKIVFSFMMYCGGFLTAIYYLAPSGAQARVQGAPQSAAFANVSIDKDAWTQRLRGGIDHVKSFAEDNALRAAELIRSQMEQSENSNSGQGSR